MNALVALLSNIRGYSTFNQSAGYNSSKYSSPHSPLNELSPSHSNSSAFIMSGSWPETSGNNKPFYKNQPNCDLLATNSNFIIKAPFNSQNVPYGIGKLFEQVNKNQQLIADNLNDYGKVHVKSNLVIASKTNADEYDIENQIELIPPNFKCIQSFNNLNEANIISLRFLTWLIIPFVFILGNIVNSVTNRAKFTEFLACCCVPDKGGGRPSLFIINMV